MNKKDLTTCFQALKLAMAYKSSLAEAWGENTKEYEESMLEFNRFQKLRVKLGKQLGLEIKNGLEKMLEEAEVVSIIDLHKRFKQCHCGNYYCSGDCG